MQTVKIHHWNITVCIYLKYKHNIQSSLQNSQIGDGPLPLFETDTPGIVITFQLSPVFSPILILHCHTTHAQQGMKA